MSTKRWELVFKALSNINRLKIIKMLLKGDKMNVTEISDKLGISFVSTSRHLIILRNYEVLEFEGMNNHINYSINSRMPKDFKTIIKTVFSQS